MNDKRIKIWKDYTGLVTQDESVAALYLPSTVEAFLSIREFSPLWVIALYGGSPPLLPIIPLIHSKKGGNNPRMELVVVLFTLVS